MKILLTRRLPGNIDLLGDHFSQVYTVEKERPLTPVELGQGLADADVAICVVTDSISEKVLPASSPLKLLITYSVGVDHIDLSLLRRRGIRLSFTPGILTAATADLAFSLILCCARRLKPAIQYVSGGQFVGYGPKLFLGARVNHTTLGIIGMGRIGSSVAMRASGFAMRLLYTSSVRLTPDRERVLNCEWVSLEELLRKSDIVSLHVPQTERTHHLITKRELNWMKRGAVLVNTSRGPVVEEKALLEHLKSNPEFFAGLDVYEHEPNILRELPDLPNVVCLPHIASAESFTREKMTMMCVEEAIRFAKRESLRYEYPL